MFRRPVPAGILVLTAIALLDLLTTLAFLKLGMAEGNPMFSRLLNHGVGPFFAAKCVFLVGPILILEYARQTHPKSAEQGTWLAVAFYALFYVLNLVSP